jgi:hypothetical protein
VDWLTRPGVKGGEPQATAPRHTGAARVVVAALAAGLGLAGIAGAQDAEVAQRLARELVPAVERATGLSFRRPPVVQVRTRDQLRGYLSRKLAQELPPAELAAVERAYRAFGLTAERTDLRRLMLDLYTEQVAGFYDPDSAALFVVRGGDPALLRLVMAHELVHALQDQYMSLSSILKLKRQNDRQMAGQAVAEGQATLASLMALAPGASLPSLSGAWSTVRQAIRDQQASMPVFAAAPRIIQEGLMFPYLWGAEFMREFAERATGDEQPYGDRLPISTEQILHPSRYTARETPVRLRFAATPGDTLVYDNDFGEFETRVVLETWGVEEDVAVAAAAGWNGDRFEIRGAPGGTVVLWASAWDSEQDAADFERALRRGWGRARAGNGGGGRGAGPAPRWQVDRLTLGGVPVVRLMSAPSSWAGWRRAPEVRLSR